MRADEYEDGDGSGDALPAEVFEQVAQTIVAQIRTMIHHRARYEPVSASDFPERDASFYDSVEGELSAVGFQTIGDFEDGAQIVTDLSKKSFVRFALGAHGAIGAMWFEVPAEGEPLRCLVLHSWLANGPVLVTARGTIDNGLPMPPELAVERVDGAVDTRSTLRVHGERVAASGKAPLRFADADELFRRYADDEHRLSEHREALGLQLFEPMLRTMLGENFEAQGEPILDAIERHPEWLRGEISAAPAPLRVGVMREEAGVDRDRFPHLVVARIPEHIEPMDRGARYEDPVQDALAIRELGVVTGGGSQLTAAAEIGYVDVELALADLDGALEVVQRILEDAGAPVGSQLLFEQDGVGVERPFGVQEGLAVYLDGTTLPEEIYAETDIDALMERLASAVDSVNGELRSAWNGPTETALYHYGPSADAMLVALQPVFNDFAICQNARLVIRQGADGETRTLRVPRHHAA
ncbi:MAG TPA: hypothetical protein VJ802_04240 [Gemmatimonadaceae bacterium]|nr:hypothetical protein [Gemmatimonadaceae bacterium]